MDNLRLWNMIVETWRGLRAGFEPATHPLAAENGLALRDFGTLVAVLCFEPESATPAHFMVRDPFTAAEAFLDRLQNLKNRNFLSETGPGMFKLTDNGRSLLQRFINVARDAMVELDPLPLQAGDRLAGLLDLLVESSLKIEPAPLTWSIRLSHKLMPDKRPPLPFIEQAITCLSAFRDDTHLAAWRHSGLSATGLEVLTIVWRGEVGSYDDLCERLSHRGHPCNVFTDVLDDLRAKGLVTGSNTGIKVSVKGRLLRTEIEEETDVHFFRPWNEMKESDKMDMEGLLSQLKSGLERARG